jgi:hypothetical protein
MYYSTLKCKSQSAGVYIIETMTHPWEKLFDKALRKSTEDENLVLAEAEDLRAKGYSVDEIYSVLTHLRDALIQDKDKNIVVEAADEFSRYL